MRRTGTAIMIGAAALALSASNGAGARAAAVAPAASEPVAAPAPLVAVAPRVVGIGDSVMGTGVAAPNGWLKQYAASIGAAEVTSLAVNGWFSHEILNALRNDPRFRQTVARADVIALNAGMNEFFTGRDLYTRGECGPDGETCLRHMVARFNTNWDAIVAEIRALAPDAPVVALTLYHPLVAYDDYYGWAEAVNRHLGAMNWHMAATAGIRIADVRRAYNGASGMDDPIAKGYILPDAIHATDAGHAVIAELVRALDVRAAPAPAREAARIVGPATGSAGLTPRPPLQTSWRGGAGRWVVPR